MSTFWIPWRAVKKRSTPSSRTFSGNFSNSYSLPPGSVYTKSATYNYEEGSVSSTSGISTPTEQLLSTFGRIEISADALDRDLKRRTLWERLTKRRAVLRAQVGLTFIVLLINIVWTIVASYTYGSQNGIGTIFTGDCGKSQLLNVYLHIAINILSTLLLGISNYCMQLISAPSREEIDRAHARKTWVDVGVPSARNVWKLNLSKKIIWCGFAITSATLHLFWNSAVFYSFPTYQYRVAVVTSDFQYINQAWPSYGGYEFEPLRQSAAGLELLQPADCINRYIEPLNAGRDVIVVTNRTAAENSNSTLIASTVTGGTVWYFEEYWICSSTEIYNAIIPGGCTTDVVDKFVSNWTVASETGLHLGKGSVAVDYCLSAGMNDSQDQCSVGFSTYIMTIVIAMNALKCAFVLFVHYKAGRSSVIGTLGDAVASFLQEPDHSTEHMCLATKRTFMSKAAWQPQAIEWRPSKTRWIGATTKRRFGVTMGIYAATFIATTGLMIAGVLGRVRDHRSIAISSLISQGLGNLDPQELLSNASRGAPTTLLATVVMANSFQVLFSCLYYMYNSVLSCMLVALEWSRYSVRKRPLRVSNPTGAQRSSYFLTIPFRYDIPLLAASSLLQWLVSQSVFLIRINNYDPTGTNTLVSQSSRIGFAPIGIIASYFLTWLMFLALLLLAFLKVYPQGDKAMPMASTCSAAISASCHRPPGDYDAWLLPVQWGVTRSRADEVEQKPGHCSFTTARDVSPPIEGRFYA